MSYSVLKLNRISTGFFHMFVLCWIIGCPVSVVWGCNMQLIKQCLKILSVPGTDLLQTQDLSAIPSTLQLRRMCTFGLFTLFAAPRAVCQCGEIYDAYKGHGNVHVRLFTPIKAGFSYPYEVDQLYPRKVDEFRACYEPNVANCTNDLVFSMTFGIIQKTTDYLCVEGHEDIIRHDTCWNKTEVKEKTTACHTDLNNRIASLRQEQMSTTAQDASELNFVWCNLVTRIRNCMGKAVYDHCGLTASCVIETMMERALGDLASLMKCERVPECTIQSGITDISTVGTTNNDGTVIDSANRMDKPSGGAIRLRTPEALLFFIPLILLFCM